MVIHIKRFKAAIIICSVFLAVLVAVGFYNMGQSSSNKIVLAAIKEQSPKDKLLGSLFLDKLLVSLFLDKLQEQSNQFYAPYYTTLPTIAGYLTTVKAVSEGGANIDITFTALPYIGPHDTIGKDEITFQVTYLGEITLENFKHLRSYPLPDNLKSIEKGDLPPTENE